MGAARPEGWTTEGRYWLISVPRAEATDGPVPRLTGGGKVLPVFGSEAEAAEFLRPDGPDGDWEVEAVDAGGLLSILSGPYCEDVEAVTLDPIPGLSGEASVRLVGVGAVRFAWHLARRLVERVA